MRPVAAFKPRLAPTAHEVADVSYQMQHLSKNDAAIERVAWLMVLGLLFTGIWLAGML